ncbi:MAG: alpha/beta hydrolase [Chitinophagaceae bacterium]|nr:alpha/beta hydrolase [Chitinophagaceae bacterium]
MINRPDRTAVLKNFSKPILFIIGEQDNAVPFAQSMQQCYLPVQSHIHILRNSAHMGMLEETAATNNFLLGFLQ